jgi:hypothetical protein
LVYSDDYNDSIASAYSFLLGLYGPGTLPKFAAQPDPTRVLPPVESSYQDQLTNISNSLLLDVLPQSQTLIPVHVLDRNHDYILDPINSCPFVFNLLDDHVSDNGKSLANLVKANEPLVTSLSKAFGIKTNAINAAEMFKMYDYANAAYYYGQDINFAINNLPADQQTGLLKIVSEYAYSYFTHGNDIQQFAVTQLLSNLSALFNYTLANYNGGLPYKRFAGYFIHDELLMPLFEVLTATNNTQNLTPYGTFLTINMTVSSQVASLSWNINDGAITTMKLDDFTAIYLNNQFGNWNDYCFGPPQSKTAATVAIVLECVLLVAVIVNWVFILRKKTGSDEPLMADP